jgi:four helix bundle protein
MKPFDFRGMRVYQLSVRLVGYLYRETVHVPVNARTIVWQLMRAAASIGLNIAEGSGEVHGLEKARFYRMARRSSWEAVAALDMLCMIGVFDKQKAQRAEPVLAEIGAMLTGLIRYHEDAAARKKAGKHSKRRGSLARSFKPIPNEAEPTNSEAAREGQAGMSLPKVGNTEPTGSS